MGKETIEEAAEKFRTDNPGTMQGGNNTKIIKAFKEGAKYQQERSYSEEDMREAFKQNYTPFDFHNIGDLEQDFQKWFEKHKKK